MKSPKSRRRIYKRRMYHLMDGELFWYFGSWDGHGNVVGKVYDSLEKRLHNKVLHRSVLEDAEVVPKGEEPWLPA